MATISKKGASVGAHIDDYSVFIFQGKGKRKWLLQSDASPDYVCDLDIRLLREFHPDEEYILEPGDMIYLPPNLAHHGVSIEDSISYSIGFKSIRYEQLLSTLLTCDDLNLENFSFHEPKNVLQENPLLVTNESYKHIKKDLINMISDDDIFSAALLRHLSKPKSEILNYGKEIKNLSSIKNKKIKRDIWAKFVSLKNDSKNFKVSVNGKIYILNATDYNLFKNIFLTSPHEYFRLDESHFKSSSFSEIFIELFNEGIFYF
jgi:50S ribosomal protein L16 3-hydroxylase